MKNAYNSKLEEFILKGLVEEWHQVSNFYGIDIRGRFFCPVFSLTDSNSYLGQWNFSTYEIKIQRAFAFKKPWSAIKSVLKHEMAHQYADIFFADETCEKPHGKSFKKACKVLRIKSSSTYDSTLDEKTDTKKEDLISKIQKLFSLASSTNKNEAELAMKKAHELMAKYNLENEELKKEPYFSTLVGKSALRHFREYYHLSSLLSEFYFVYPVWIPYFIINKGKMGKVLEITGKKTNVETASYVFDYINRYIDLSWIDFKEEKKFTRYEKTDFAIGIIEGFASKLRQNNIVFKGRSNLPLVIKTDPEINDYLNWYYPRLRKNFKKGGIKKDFYEEGLKKGDKLIISKGIKENEKKSELMLPS